MKIGDISIKWLGNAGFMIKGRDMVIYIDPYGISSNVPEEDKADIIMITHEYFGHCEPESIRKVRKSDCTTLIPENMSLQFRGDARRIMAGDSLTGDLSIKGVDIEVVPAYGPCDDASSRGSGVGYLFIFEGLRIYHAGHTCMVGDPQAISPDIALLPIAGGSVMDERQASDAVELLSPGMVIPMGYDTDDLSGDPEVFSDMVKDSSPSIEVFIP